MRTYKKWTDAELQFINDNLASFSDQEIAAKLSAMTSESISTGMVRRQRRKLGVAKKRGRPPKNRVVENADS